MTEAFTWIFRIIFEIATVPCFNSDRHCRLDSWREQRLAEEKLREKKRMIEEENMRYRLEDWQDLQKYKEQLKLEEMKNLLDRMVF